MTDVPSLGELEQLVLLAILQCGDDAYTVPIGERLAHGSRRRLARGALYTSLDRLEVEGPRPIARWASRSPCAAAARAATSPSPRPGSTRCAPRATPC